MNLPCKVIEDMLPMYYDGICSSESAELIDKHLQNCPQCAQMLSDLHSSIDIPHPPVDDLKALEGIQAKWKHQKQSYIRRGIASTLAALLLIVAVLSGVWYFSYGKEYYRLAGVMDRPSNEDQFISSADYTLQKDGYRFDINMPLPLSNSGFVRVMDESGLVLFLYPERNGAYSFWFFITDTHNQSYSVHLKSDMTPDFENYPFPVRSEPEQNHIRQLLIEQNADIAAMLDAVEALWDIDLLQFAA